MPGRQKQGGSTAPDRKEPKVVTREAKTALPGLAEGTPVRVEHVDKDIAILTFWDRAFAMGEDGQSGGMSDVPRTVTVSRSVYDSKFKPTDKDIPA